jgi:hypothetical protein
MNPQNPWEMPDTDDKNVDNLAAGAECREKNEHQREL